MSADPEAADSVAVIGTGPRGISILERLGARLLAVPPSRPLTIHAIDADEVGAGRVWRSDQPPWLAMNNRAGEVTMFSGPADERPWRPGAGPTFAQWWRSMEPGFPGPDAYAPRSLYGRYLHFVLDVIETNLPLDVTLTRVDGLVGSIEERAGQFELETEDRRILCDQVAVCTGHPREPSAHDELAVARRPVAAAPGGAAPVDPGEVVGILGLGLTFHDVLAALTVGRGGHFVGRGRDQRYVPSGAEPGLIVAGSRAALPIPVRGRPADPRDTAYEPVLFTPERVARLRSRGPLDFRAEILPWLEAELGVAFRERRLGPSARARFRAEVLRLHGSDVPGAEVADAVRAVAPELGATGTPSLADLSDPFRDRAFTDQAAFRRELALLVRDDVDEALRGEAESPHKFAVEILRRVRPTVRAAVDFGGLTAASHRDFVERIGPTLAFLTTGPSLERSGQLLALLRCGLLDVLGPRARFTAREGDGAVVGHSPSVAGHEVVCSRVVDARIRPPDVTREQDLLTSHQRGAGVWRAHVRDGRPAFRTGGLDVTPAPYHPIAADGSVEHRMYVLGIPTESTRWFTQVGIARPGGWGEFFRDADAVAGSVLAGTAHRAGPPAPRADGGAPRPGPRPVGVPLSGSALSGGVS